MKKSWQEFEHYVANLFGLDTTIASGSKFYDSGDAVTRGRRHPWPLWADAKYTQAKSFSLKLKDLEDYTVRAIELGKRFILPLRFQETPWVVADYVVMPLADFKEVYDRAFPDGGN